MDLSVPEPGQEVPGLLFLGIAEDLIAGAFFADDTVGHEYNPVGDISGKGHLVCNYKHGHTQIGRAHV